MNYVVAVSGGVDSTVLLDMLVNDRCIGLHVRPEDIIVAHFDHGIRTDSSTDEEFVRGVVGDYGLRYESSRVHLGAGTSEATARNMRYKFLRQCCKKYSAQLVTAHHQDDIVETMLINLIRGTNWRGLVSLDSDQLTTRPLLEFTKSQLLDYAHKYSLVWHEDSTNIDQSYLRNYIRQTLLPTMTRKDSTATEQLVRINSHTRDLKNKIATELQKICSKYQTSNTSYDIPRYDLIMYPPIVAKEITYYILTQLDPQWHPNSVQIERVLHFVKTGKSHKKLEVSKRLKIALSVNAVQFKNS